MNIPATSDISQITQERETPKGVTGEIMSKLFLFVGLGVSAVLFTPPAHSQAQYAAPATNCLRPFYDPANYNWYAFTNNCTDT